MAESQSRSPYGLQTWRTLTGSLSNARLQSYLSHRSINGDRDAAIKLYLWNSRLAKAFLFPIHIVEVTVRNAVHAAIGAQFQSPAWLRNVPFQLTPESQGSLDKAINRLAGTATEGCIVAALTFDFWSNLFRDDYDTLWAQNLLPRAFPLMPAGIGRQDIQGLVRPINRLRNRIAHHEPIFAQNHWHAFRDILTLIGYCNVDLKDWTKTHSTVMAVARTPPTQSSMIPGMPVASLSVRPAPTIGPNDTITRALTLLNQSRPPVLLLMDGTKVADVLTQSRVLQFFEARANTKDDFVIFSAESVGALLTATPAPHYVCVDDDMTTGDLRDIFFNANPRPELVLVYTSKNSKLRGVLLHPGLRW